MTIPSFHLFVQTLIVGVLVGGVYALMSSGLTLIFGVMRVINVAHGAFLILGAYITYVLFQRFHLDPMISILITIPLLFGFGWVLQRYMLSRIESPEQTSVLVTFALALVLEGLMGVVFQTTFRSVKPSYATEALIFATYRFPVTRLMGFGVALVILLLLYLILQYTNLGRAIRATAEELRVRGHHVERRDGAERVEEHFHVAGLRILGDDRKRSIRLPAGAAFKTAANSS